RSGSAPKEPARVRPGMSSPSRRGIRKPKEVGTMTVRKRMPAALLGAALITLALTVLGGQSAPNFGDPFPGRAADRQARSSAGTANFQTVETVPGGLGPVFNNPSCANCHSSPATGGGSTTLETRFGLTVNGQFNPLTQLGGSLIQS